MIYSQEIESGLPIPKVFRGDDKKNALFSKANPFWDLARGKFFWNSKARLIAFQLKSCPKTTYFGFFSSEDNFTAASELISNVESWARENGSQDIVGPLNLKTAFNYRFRTCDFDEPSFWGEPENPSYYVSFIEKLGYEIYQSYSTDYIENLADLRPIAKKKLGRLPEATELGLEFRPFALDLWPQFKEDCFFIANKVFQENTEFTSLTHFDFEILYSEQILEKVCAKTSFFIVEAQSKMLVGFCMNFADPNAPERLLVKSIGVLPEYRLGGKSFVACMKYLFANSLDYSKMAFCLMQEGNQIQKLTKKYCEKKRTYALFRREI